MPGSSTNQRTRKETAKSKRPPRKPKTKAATLSNEELLQLAAKRRPPQSWYDEGVNPFEPKR
jgi:hypothetical protein